MTAASLTIVLLAFAQTCFAQQFPLETVTVEGGTYPQAFVLKWSGLKIGQTADNAVFSEACAKLQATGLFRAAAFRYAPGAKGGYALVLHLEPEASLVDAELDIPEIADNEALWAWLRANYPLNEHRVPENDAALSFYSRAIEKYLASNGEKEDITTRLGGGFGPGAKLTVLFQPKNLPKVGTVRFEGTHSFGAGDLEKRIAGVALQSDYSPSQFRLLIEQNIRPIYEERGFLNVVFVNRSEKPADGAVAVTTTVTEGRTYHLGKVNLEGEGISSDELMKSGGFKIGQLANWREIEAAVAAAERPLRRNGYITLKSQLDRQLQDDTGMVDLTVHMRKGLQLSLARYKYRGSRPR